MRFTALAFCLTCLAAPTHADPVGLWQTQAANGEVAIVEIAPCGSALCGTVKESHGKGGVPTPEMHGKVVISEMMRVGAGYAGKLWHPRLGLAFKGTMEESSARLTLSGCALGGAICRDQVWTRAE